MRDGHAGSAINQQSFTLKFMKTHTTKHQLSGDTVALARELKRLENKTTPGNALRAYLCDGIRKELEWRRDAAMRLVF